MALIGVQEPRRATPRFDLVLCRHAPPVQVLVLKNSPFDLMTRTALIVREPPHRSDPQSVESPNGPGNPSGCCDPLLEWQIVNKWVSASIRPADASDIGGSLVSP